MNIRSYITGVARTNRDGTSRQQIIGRLRDDEDLYLYDAANEKNPSSIAVINHDNQLCGFLDHDLARAIRRWTRNIGDIVVYVHQIVPDQDGLLQCEMEFDIPADSPIGQAYYGPPEDAPAPQRRSRSVPTNAYTEDATPSRQRTNETRLLCSRCGSTNIHVQAVNEVKSKRGCFGCMMQIIALPLGCFWWFLALLIPKKVKSKTRAYAVCQNCGNQWRV